MKRRERSLTASAIDTVRAKANGPSINPGPPEFAMGLGLDIAPPKWLLYLNISPLACTGAEKASTFTRDRELFEKPGSSASCVNFKEEMPCSIPPFE